MKHSKSEEEFLSWKEFTAETCAKIYTLAVEHFSRRYLANMTRNGDPHFWGNEMESVILQKQHKNTYALSTSHCHDQLARLSNKLTLMPEFARFILEFIPAAPFDGELRGLRLRCNEYTTHVTDLLAATELEGLTILLGTCSPVFGKDFLVDMDTFRSQTPDQLKLLKAKMLDYVTTAGRYRTLVSNMLLRKGSIPWTTVSSNCGDTYYLPGPLFGMGLCGMHVTIQSATMEDSRLLYDAFQPLCPVLLALSASTSVLAGAVLDKDTRTSYLSDAMDDRPLHDHSMKQLRRYSIAGLYIANHPANISLLNDLPPFSSEFNSGASIFHSIDADSKIHAYVQSVTSHFPLVILKDSLAFHDESASSDCWDQVHSLVWPSCRWKVPPMDSPKECTGWRTEIRCMEMQFSIAENLAYSVFVFLLSNAIRDMGLLFYIPQSFILQDMSSAEKRDAVTNELFWVRDVFLDLHFESVSGTNVRISSSGLFPTRCKQMAIEIFSSQIRLALENRRAFATLSSANDAGTHTHTWCPKNVCTCFENSISDFHLIRVSLKELMCGSARYPGLLPVLAMYTDAYFDTVTDSASLDDVEYIHSVISYLADRAAGAIPTCATAVRNLIQNIHTYRSNSLTEACSDILSETEIQKITEYMLGARRLPLDSLREYYKARAATVSTPE
ncbi:Glutamate-cysteine ligase [Giardia lamblia P15]|uniref:Glutamate--cysteine ligase n=1 Tax=Giardia intestinalis (strain P15) TaxID=658858 RepID=E1F986_GIAIA|nr:Glutamate-cysteine ligase [Giardia lamblia P15]